MPNPLLPFVVSGTCYKGPHQGTVSVSSVVDSSGGATINLTVSNGVELATSATVSVLLGSTTLTVSTNSNGEYVLDLANFGSYNEGDSFTVTLDTRSSTSENLDVTHLGAKSYKVTMVDKQGKEYDAKYPLPTQFSTFFMGHPEVYGNCSVDWNITRSDGQPDSVLVTLPDGTSYKRTFTYNSNNFLVGQTKWVKQ